MASLSDYFKHIIALIVILALIILGTFYFLFTTSVSRYEAKIFEQVSQRSYALAIKQRELTRVKMDDLDRILLTLRDAVHNKNFDLHQLTELFLLQKSYSREVADFLLLDNTGDILTWTRSESKPKVNDRDYFKWHLENDQDHAFLLSTQVARVDNPFKFIALSRKIKDHNGQMTGVIVATIDIEKFAKSLDDKLYDGQLTHLLVNENAKIIFRLPFVEEAVDQTLASLDRYANAIPEHDSYMITSPFDDQPRRVTFQRVPNWPLLVFIGEDLSYAQQLITEFKQQELKRWVSLAGLILFLGAVIFLLLKRRLDIDRQILRQRKELDDFHRRNHAILEAMPDLVFTLDKTGIILDCQSHNKALLYMQPEDFLGRTFTEIMPSSVVKISQHYFEQVIYTEKPQQFEYTLTIYNELLHFEMRMSKIDDDNILAIARDITMSKNALLQLTWQATHDALTRLPNRVLFYDQLSQHIHSSHSKDAPFALLYIDIDGFKPVNDTLGHSLGDQLLIAFSDRLSINLRESDFLARLAGDEFAMIVSNCKSDNDAAQLVKMLLNVIEKPFNINDHEIHISASIGFVWTENWQDSIDSLVHAADQKMYLEKARSKSGTESIKQANND